MHNVMNSVGAFDKSKSSGVKGTDLIKDRGTIVSYE